MSQDDVEILLTQRGHDKVVQRLEHLRHVQRHDIAELIRDSKQFGDITENAEYEDAKNQQALVESQIAELRRILLVSQILDEASIPLDYVGLGSVVQLTGVDNDDEWEMTLVSPIEADPDHDYISNESPIGEAIWGKKVGETVRVETPDGSVSYRIDSIRK
jgi:transcription elongation factor GreA